MVKIYLAEFAKSGGPTLDEDLAWKEIKGQSFGGSSLLRDAFQLILLPALVYWTYVIADFKIDADSGKGSRSLLPRRVSSHCARRTS
jgi:hypothetical protein